MSHGSPQSGATKGFKRLSVALAVYAASSAVESASAGLYVAADSANRAGDPATGPLGLAAFVTLGIGGVLALLSFVAAFIILYRMKRTILTAFRDGTSAVSWSWGLFLWSSVFAAFGGIVFLMTWFARTLAQVIAGQKFGAAVLAVSALFFLAGMTLPAFKLSAGRDRAAVWTAIILGAVGVFGEAVASVLFVIPDSSSPLNYFTFGGFPLLNWSAPFGPVVAVGAGLLAWTYWRLAKLEPPWEAGPTTAGAF